MDEECFESSMVPHAVHSAEVAELVTNLSLPKLVNCNHQTAMIEIFQSQQITTTLSCLITSAKENATSNETLDFAIADSIQCAIEFWIRTADGFVLHGKFKELLIE